MLRVFCLIAVLGTLYGCGGSGSSNNSTTDPEAILGDWYFEFERNGATARNHLVITDGYLDSYEVGNGQVMDEWYSGLEIDKSYKFTTDGYDASFTIEDGEMITNPSESGLSVARIFELPDEVEIANWEMEQDRSSEGERVSFSVSGSQLTITDSQGSEFRYTRTE